MDDYKVDYHIHTTASDGLSTPTEIVKQAKALDYDIIAITDHDNTDGIAEAEIAGRAVDLKVVPGIEIAVLTDKNIGLHILGYNIDPENPELRNFLDRLIADRKERNDRMFQVLQEIGCPLTRADIDVGKNDFIGKPLIARAIVKKGFAGTIKEAFGEDFLGHTKCREIKRSKPSAEETIKMILAAGGTPVLAHPIQTKGIGKPGSREFFKRIDEIIRGLKLQGLKGIECFHPDQTEEQSMKFVEIAEKYHLHITRGSDFHGDDFAKAEKTANEKQPGER